MQPVAVHEHQNALTKAGIDGLLFDEFVLFEVADELGVQIQLDFFAECAVYFFHLFYLIGLYFTHRK